MNISMPLKRASRGRKKGSKGSSAVVQCTNCGPTLPCDWIEVHGRTANLKNENIGYVVGSESFFPSQLINF